MLQYSFCMNFIQKENVLKILMYTLEIIPLRTLENTADQLSTAQRRERSILIDTKHQVPTFYSTISTSTVK